MEKYDKWVMLLAGLVVGWFVSTIWPGFVSASSSAHWWEIATAVGTIGAALGAVYSARIAIKVSVYSQKRIDAANRDAAISYLYGHVSHFFEGELILSEVLKQQALSSDFNNFNPVLDRLKKLNASFTSFDFNKAFLVHKKYRDLVSASIHHLRRLEVNLQAPEVERRLLFNKTHQSLLDLEITFLRALRVAIEDIVEGREGWETFLDPEWLRVNWSSKR